MRKLHPEGLFDGHSGEAPTDVVIPAVQQVEVGAAQVAVEHGVDEGVHEGVGVAKPQQRAFQPHGYTVTLCTADEGPHGTQDEKGQPAYGENTHDHPQGGGRLLFPPEDGGAVMLVSQKVGQGAAVFWHLGWGLQGLHFKVLLQVRGTYRHEGHKLLLGAALACCLEDLIIEDEHDGQRDVESKARGVDGVAEVLADQTHPTPVDILSPATEGWQGDRSRDQPHDQNHLGHQLTVLPGRICQGSCDAKVPVQDTAGGGRPD